MIQPETKKMFSTILVPMDLSGLPSRTAALTSRFAAEQNATLHFLYVLDVARDFATAAFTVLDDELIESHEREIAKLLAQAVDDALRFGARAESHIIHGAPTWELILDEANAVGADLIVMRTHGRKGLSRAVNGSVTEDVVRHGGMPVLVLREP
jgi:nucleotide-binding universal stress UspA family protein